MCSELVNNVAHRPMMSSDLLSYQKRNNNSQYQLKYLRLKKTQAIQWRYGCEYCVRFCLANAKSYSNKEILSVIIEPKAEQKCEVLGISRRREPSSRPNRYPRTIHGG